MTALIYSRDDVGMFVEREVMAERERCAKIVENVYMHTSSQTVERDVANRLCPRIASAIRSGAQPR